MSTTHPTSSEIQKMGSDSTQRGSRFQCWQLARRCTSPNCWLTPHSDLRILVVIRYWTSAHILKARVTGVQVPQTILNLPQNSQNLDDLHILTSLMPNFVVEIYDFSAEFCHRDFQTFFCGFFRAFRYKL